MNIRRIQGLQKEISKIIGSSILFDVKNEKIKQWVTVKDVILSKDGKYCDVYYSVMEFKQDINKDKILEDLKKLNGFFRKQISKELSLRYSPEIRAHLDTSTEYSIKITELLNESKK